MISALFRKEALDAQRGDWLGEISLAQPMQLKGFAAAATITAIAILLLLAYGTYTKRTRVAGEIVPSAGLATVISPETGVVERIHSIEEAEIRAGDLLATVIVPRITDDAEETNSAQQKQIARRAGSANVTRLASKAIIDAQAKGLSARIDSARSELQRIEAEVTIRRQQAQLAAEILERLRHLEGGKFVSALQVQQQESTMLDRQSEVQALLRQAASTERMIAELQQSLGTLTGERMASNADYERDLAVLEQERLEARARSGLTVTAPIDGLIANQLVKTGQSVRAGQALFTLIPKDSDLEAQLLVPSRAIGFIEVGDPVLLRYQSYPYQKFGQHRGHIARISRSALTADDLGALAGRGDDIEPRYRVVVRLDQQTVTAYGREEPLRPGMLLEADILGEQRSLFEWLFEPLYSVRKIASTNRCAVGKPLSCDAT
ncbi:MAG: HlyD family efflux transporter periplasmic adaptor subunit [Rhodanobacteraceae bacterium]|nr:HlyD family efflux transporter periplasmic adaptor subunit [Rhodanobacteraceae bacterium]